MENAAEAIKMAGFTLIFVIALSISMITLMKSKDVSEQIISYSDKTKYYSHIGDDVSNIGGNRIINVNYIFPTLYRYQQEQYIILFEDKNGNPLKILDEEDKEGNSISYLNYNLESYNKEDWTRSNADVKTHVDNVVRYLSTNSYFTNKKFEEKITTTSDEYKTNSGQIITLPNADGTSTNPNESSSDTSTTNIRVITYTLQ